MADVDSGAPDDLQCRTVATLEHANGAWLRVGTTRIADETAVLSLERGRPGDVTAEAAVTWPLARLDELLAALHAARD